MRPAGVDTEMHILKADDGTLRDAKDNDELRLWPGIISSVLRFRFLLFMMVLFFSCIKFIAVLSTQHNIPSVPLTSLDACPITIVIPSYSRMKSLPKLIAHLLCVRNMRNSNSEIIINHVSQESWDLRSNINIAATSEFLWIS